MKTYIEIREKTNYTVFAMGWPIGSFPTRLQAERWIQQEAEKVVSEMLAEVPSELKYARPGPEDLGFKSRRAYTRRCI